MGSLVPVVIASDILMYFTFPLHVRQKSNNCRLLYILLHSNKKVHLDGSFHTLMIHTTFVNLIYSLVFCFIQAPAATGVLFYFYHAVGPYAAKIEMIKSTTIILLGSTFHLVLALSRFTAISQPTKHVFIWQKLSRICFVLWLITLAFSVPLLMPGTTDFLVKVNVFGLRSIEFTFLGNYFAIYSTGSSAAGAFMEVITILCYAGMITKFREFTKLRKSGSTEIQRMTIGVIRTTVAAMCTSMGSWIIVFFFIIFFLGPFLTRDPIHESVFSVFGLLNSINISLTPWVLLVAFPNLRRRFFTVKCSMTPSTSE